MGPRARRVLFALTEPGYSRFTARRSPSSRGAGGTSRWSIAIQTSAAANLLIPEADRERVRSLGRLPGQPSQAATIVRVGVDYLRYLEPAFARATYLRRRAEKRLPPSLAFMKRIRRVPRVVVSAGIALARMVERALPVDRAVLAFVREARPDVVVVSPLVIVGGSGVHETEVVKAARALRIPTIVGVASWDHLTSKGLVRVVPDAVLVWNDAQADEAEQLHRIPRKRIVVTGAQSLDRWFDRPSPGSLDAFSSGPRHRTRRPRAAVGRIVSQHGAGRLRGAVHAAVARGGACVGRSGGARRVRPGAPASRSRRAVAGCRVRRSTRRRVPEDVRGARAVVRGRAVSGSWCSRAAR